MRVKISLGLVAGAALLAIAACGGDDDKKESRCPVEVDEAGVERAACANPLCADHPSCEVCDDGVDNTGNGLVDCADPTCAEHEACVENCTDGVDNNANGLADCADPACQDHKACAGWVCGAEGCAPGCERQTPDCAGSPYAGLALTSICNAGRCEEVGRVDKEGDAEVAELDAQVRIDGVGAPKGLRSAIIDVLYKERAGDEGALTCPQVVELLRAGALRDNPSINIAAHAEMDVQADDGANTLSVNLNRVPLPRDEDKTYLMVVHFYNAKPDVEGKARGALVAFACDDEVAPSAKEVTLRARNACEPNEPGSCQEGWTCMQGVCRYDCSIQCNVNQACREVDGQDVCLRECGESYACKDGERCDQSFPWNQAACVPE